MPLVAPSTLSGRDDDANVPARHPSGNFRKRGIGAGATVEPTRWTLLSDDPPSRARTGPRWIDPRAQWHGMWARLVQLADRTGLAVLRPGYGADPAWCEPGTNAHAAQHFFTFPGRHRCRSAPVCGLLGMRSNRDHFQGVSSMTILKKLRGRVPPSAQSLALACGIVAAASVLSADAAFAGTDATFNTALTKFTNFLQGSGGKIITVLSLAGGIVGLASGRFSLGQVAIPVGVGVGAGTGIPIVTSTVTATI